MLGMIHQELASELKRILSGRVGKLVDEALEIRSRLGCCSPHARSRQVHEDAHRVIDQQFGMS